MVAVQGFCKRSAVQSFCKWSTTQFHARAAGSEPNPLLTATTARNHSLASSCTAQNHSLCTFQTAYRNCAPPRASPARVDPTAIKPEASKSRTMQSKETRDFTIPAAVKYNLSPSPPRCSRSHKDTADRRVHQPDCASTGTGPNSWQPHVLSGSSHLPPSTTLRPRSLSARSHSPPSPTLPGTRCLQMCMHGSERAELLHPPQEPPHPKQL